VSAGLRAGTKSFLFPPYTPLAMGGSISESWTHLKASQQQQLDAVVSTGAGMCIDFTSAKQGTLLTHQAQIPHRPTVRRLMPSHPSTKLVGTSRWTSPSPGNGNLTEYLATIRRPQRNRG
jgi:hypothetical protein